MRTKKFLTFALSLIMFISLFQFSIAAEGANVTFVALDGRNTNGLEGYSNLFDGNTETKWCVGSAYDMPYVIAKAQERVIVTAYTFTTANDTASNPTRNPKTWTLYSCDDYDEQTKSGGWEKIHSVENDTSMPKENYASQSFSCAANTKFYKYYKFEIKASGSFLQLSEIEFTCDTCLHEWGETSQTEATCVLPAYEIQTCTKCSKVKKTQTAPANGHTWASESVQEATCTEAEYTTYRCENCEATKTEQTAPANGHTYDENGICTVCKIIIPVKIGDSFYKSLADAVDAANEGDTITLLRNFSTDSTLSISKNNLTLNLNGFTVTKTGNGSVIVISNGSTFTLTDLSEEKTGTVTGGSAENGGDVYVGENCTFNMSGCKISNCTAQNKGGAVAAYSGSTVNICENSEITENVSLGDGGAIYAENSAVNVNGYSVIQNNRAENHSGGAIYAGNSSNVTIDYCVISENTANGNGGGVYALNSAVTMENGSVNSNNAVFGGGIYIHSSELVMNDGEIWDNKASNFGGGVMVQIGSGASSATINGGSISNNIAENDTNGGGGFWVNGSSIYSATLTVNGGQISNNIAKNGYGGGIRLQNSYAHLNLNGGIVMSNSALLGGGIYNSGNLTVTGAPHIYSNALESNNKIINNIYLPRDKTVIIGEGGLQMDSATYIFPIIGVTLEQPSAVNTIAQCDSDYSFGFQSDDTNYIPTYDAENKKIILAESVHIILDPQVEGVNSSDAYAAKGGIFPEPTDKPYKYGYRFLGWYKDGERYEFGQTVTEDFTLTAKWAKEGEAAIELTSESYIVSGLDGEGIVYLASYNENGAVIDTKCITATNLEMPIVKTLLSTEGAAQIKAFLWDNNMTPLCENAFRTLKQAN